MLGVYVLCVVCCAAVCFLIDLSCVYVLFLLLCFPCCVFCRGVNAFPVWLYGVCPLFALLFPLLCDVVCLFMCLCYGLYVLFVYR